MCLSADNSAKIFWSVLVLVLYLCSFGSGLPDSVNAAFNKGASTYDTVLLKKAFNQGAPTNEKREYLFQAKCLWRIQVVKFLLADNKGSITYGKRALALLDSAEQAGVDRYSVTAVRALVTQLLAGTGLANGAVYGPQTGAHLSIIKKLQPSGFYTRLVEAFNYLEAPAFTGGDPQKAKEMFANLHKDYPESTIVTINLARSLLKTKRAKEADSLCSMVLEKTPDDLWAKKVKEATGRAK